MSERTDTTLIKNFREMCGDETHEGYILTFNGINVPNYIEYEHESVYPEMVITPFITKREIETPSEIIKEEEREDVQLNKARFQVDIYSKDTLELMQIKEELEKRLKNFMRPEIIVYKDILGFEEDNGIYNNIYFNDSVNIIKIAEPICQFNKKESLEEMTEPGSWFIYDNALYVNPMNDMQDIEIYTLLNGRAFPNGETVFDRGIYGIGVEMSRKIPDPEPGVERWIFDFMITYSTTEIKHLGPELKGVRIHGERD